MRRSAFRPGRVDPSILLFPFIHAVFINQITLRCGFFRTRRAPRSEEESELVARGFSRLLRPQHERDHRHSVVCDVVVKVREGKVARDVVKGVGRDREVAAVHRHTANRVANAEKELKPTK